MQDQRSLKFVSLGLIVLYILSLIVYARAAASSLGLHGWILTGIFGGLLVCAVGLFFGKELARKAVVILNSFLCGYVVVLLFNPQYQEIVHASYALTAAVIVWFFSRQVVKASFIDSPPTKWQTILVVDDDETILHLVRSILVRAGYAVLTAATGEEGLSMAQHQKPDLILLDVILPKKKGREICRQLKENPLTAAIPVIFLTVKDSPDDIRAELEMGAVAHLTKPVNTNLLLSTIKKILDR